MHPISDILRTQGARLAPPTTARFLVTGAAGFIGSHLVRLLLQEGHSVIGLDALTSYYDPRLKLANLSPLLGHHRFTFMEHDILDAPLADLARGVDFLLHFAGQPGVRSDPDAGPQLYQRNNVQTTQLLLEASRGLPIQRLVFVSSSSVYGRAGLPTREDNPTRPISPYGISKLAAEALCWKYHRAYGLPVVVVRPFSVYGPGQRPDMFIHRFIAAALQRQPITIYGDGLQERDFTYISDAVEGLYRAVIYGRAGSTYNIASGRPVSLLHVIQCIAQEVGALPPIRWEPPRPEEPRRTWADISLACRELGYAPRTSLRKGLREQIAHLQRMLNKQSADPLLSQAR